jgi:hypothetical protein
VGVGRTGNAYAIPTKDSHPKLFPLPLQAIETYVCGFLNYARDNPDLEFEVTRVGCGLAGYKNEQIAPFFRNAPPNCYLPEEWKNL